MASDVNNLLDNNKRWAARMIERDPHFFADLADQQTPEYLWIGCSDSRVAANTIVGLMPGEIFVHRNVANLVNHTDMNCLSVIQFAVEVLKVKHIIVCGHYGCGGVTAALEGNGHGLIDNWLRHIQDTANKHSRKLAEFGDAAARLNALCELNVIEQVLNVSQTTIVADAWNRGQQVVVHGWIYELKDGVISDLDISVDGETALAKLRNSPVAGSEFLQSAGTTA
jgi:carbonic anhydrase